MVHMHIALHILMSLSSVSPAGGTVWKVVDILVQKCIVRLSLKAESLFTSGKVQGVPTACSRSCYAFPVMMGWNHRPKQMSLPLSCFCQVLGHLLVRWWEKQGTHWFLGIRLLWTMTECFCAARSMEFSGTKEDNSASDGSCTFWFLKNVLINHSAG